MDPPHTLRASYHSGDVAWSCIAHVDEASARFVFYTLYPAVAPPGQAQAMMEFVTRANSGLMSGAFEFDLDTGQVMARTSVSGVDGEGYTPRLVERTVLDNLLLMERYAPGFAAVAAGDLSPGAALDAVE